MTKNARKRMKGSRFLSDRLGNFSMMTAIIFPVMLAAGGVAIDLTNMIMTRAALQDATDSAALAAASALANDGMTAAEAKLVAMRFLKTQVNGGGVIENSKDEEDDISSVTSVDITEKALLGTGKSFTVDVSLSHTIEFNALTRLLGQTSKTLTTKSTAESATESKNALSMFLVLDKSGSMAWITNEKDNSVASCINWTEKNWGKKVSATSPCYIPKMAALKLAVANLFTQITVADPTKTFARTASVSYDLVSYAPTALEWGVSSAMTYVNNLVANGGTASTDAMKAAYNKLMEPSENTAHKSKNGQVPTKYIVFMTDGDNNNKKDDTKTKAVCDDARRDKIEVYTVAFMAPERGQELLQYCATTTDHYFEAEDMAALVKAFKTIGERTSAVVSRLTK